MTTWNWLPRHPPWLVAEEASRLEPQSVHLKFVRDAGSGHLRINRQKCVLARKSSDENSPISPHSRCSAVVSSRIKRWITLDVDVERSAKAVGITESSAL